MKISILVPTYNAGALIRAALKSALAQSHGDVEILVSDNASTDDTRSVVEGLADSRIRYFRHSVNIGYTRNVRSLIERAAGEFSVILCADDAWIGDFLGETVRAVRPETSLVYTAYERRVVDLHGGEWSEEVRAGRPGYCSGVSYVRAEFLRPFSILSACLFRTSCARAAGSFLDPGLRVLPDFVHRLRVAVQGEVAYLDRPLAFYLEHPASLTNSTRAADWAREEVEVARMLLEDPALRPASLQDLADEKRRRHVRWALGRIAELRASGVRSRELDAFARAASGGMGGAGHLAMRGEARLLGLLPPWVAKVGLHLRKGRRRRG